MWINNKQEPPYHDCRHALQRAEGEGLPRAVLRDKITDTNIKYMQYKIKAAGEVIYLWELQIYLHHSNRHELHSSNGYIVGLGATVPGQYASHIICA